MQRSRLIALPVVGDSIVELSDYGVTPAGR